MSVKVFPQCTPINTKKEKTRIIAVFSANDFDDEDIIKNYLDEKIKKEIRWKEVY